MTPKRYALVGAGSRGLGMFAQPLSKDFPDTACLSALVDVNPIRAEAASAQLPTPVPVYTDFARMLQDVDPDGVVVASRDCTHAPYIIAALRAGKRAISEKPLCTTAGQCREILGAAAESKAQCLVTHNCRYGMPEETIHAVIRSGRLGAILFVEFEETLDRRHGADYFRRWHRQKANSGGLVIHKASHHFDEINWWLGATPVWVIAQGRLALYGANGPFRHVRCRSCPHAAKCEFYVDMFQNEHNRRMYLEAESADGYLRDGCVFDKSIDIEDQIHMLVRYDSGVYANYTLNAYCPFESQRIVIEGTLGRLEYIARHSGQWATPSERQRLTVYLPGRPGEDIPIRHTDEEHGGADPRLRADFFGRDWDASPNEQMASVQEAAQAVLIGVAANRSMATGRPVDVQRLLQGDQ